MSRACLISTPRADSLNAIISNSYSFKLDQNWHNERIQPVAAGLAEQLTSKVILNAAKVLNHFEDCFKH